MESWFVSRIYDGEKQLKNEEKKRERKPTLVPWSWQERLLSPGESWGARLQNMPILLTTLPQSKALLLVSHWLICHIAVPALSHLYPLCERQIHNDKGNMYIQDDAGLCMNSHHFTTKNINQISIAIKLLFTFSPLPFSRPRSSHILCISFVHISTFMLWVNSICYHKWFTFFPV